MASIRSFIQAEALAFSAVHTYAALPLEREAAFSVASPELTRWYDMALLLSIDSLASARAIGAPARL